MQRLTALTCSDPALMADLARANPEAVDVAAELSAGSWGVGFYGHGELLVRKIPARSGPTPLSLVANVQARHVVLVADDRSPRPFRGETSQPMRYRDWLFAMSGGSELGAELVTAVDRRLAGFVVRAARGGTAPEAVMMLFMDALHRATLLDARLLSTHGVRRALAVAANTLAELAGDRQALDLAVTLHARSYHFAVGLGRPLYVQKLQGYPGSSRGQRRRRPGLKSVVITDRLLGAGRLIEPWHGVEVTAEGEVLDFGLDASGAA